MLPIILIGQPDSLALKLDVVAVNLPYQKYSTNATGNFIRGVMNPSMSQSQSLSNNFYSTAHWGVKQVVNVKSEFLEILLQYTGAAAFDLLTSSVPLGSGWLHEEFHRAVLTKNEVNSFNEINSFPIGQPTVSVNRIMDEELAKIADANSPEFARLMSAGLEASYLQIRNLQMDNFYFAQDLPHLPQYWLNTFNNIFYVNQSGDENYFDELIDEANRKEADNISSRDFTGPDFTAWVHELFNPEVPYAARGIHPGGVGFNRYIKPSSLAQEELEYLRKQGNLQWLNLISPNLYGFPRIRFLVNESGAYFGNFAVRHLLTPYGNDISLDIFLQTPQRNWFLGLHNYNNFSRAFYGVEVGIIDEKLVIEEWRFSTSFHLWMQPQELAFRTSDATPGAAIDLQVSKLFHAWAPFISISAKSQGWLAGNLFLERNISMRLGLSYRLKP